MSKMVMLLCSIFLLACSLLSQDSSTVPPTATEVMKFFEVMHVREQSEAMLQAQQKQIKVMIGDMFNKELPNATPAERTKLDDLMNSAMTDLFANYPIDDILRDMVPVYQKHLSESDLNAVVTFYSSAVGQKLLREMPAMTSEAMRVSYARLQPRIEQMIENMHSRAKQMAEQNSSTTSPKK